MSLLHRTIIRINVNKTSQLFSEFLFVQEMVEIISICNERGIFPSEYCIEGEKLDF